MKEIQLTQGKVALVDDSDFEYLNQWKWYAWKPRKVYYAVRSIGSGANKSTIYMHRVILNLTDPKIQADHRDINGLNNQRSNLRAATNQQNNANQAPMLNFTSKYIGVSWNAPSKRWRVRVKRKHIGYYDQEDVAAIAYNNAAKNIYGEFANLNAV